METKNEIMENEEIVETAEEIMAESSGKAIKVLGVIGGVVLVAGLGYKYIAKPWLAKRKAQKELESEIVEDYDEEEVEVNPAESEED